MPELPEVETLRRGIEPRVRDRTVVDAWGHPSAKFAGAIEAVGSSIERVDRRGKYLLFGLDDGRELIVHLGMTGQLGVRPARSTDPYVRAWFALDDEHVLEYRDVRRFGRLGTVHPPDYRRFPTLAVQGPEPWDPALDDGGFWRSLRGSSSKLKTRLLSQRPLAGVGNIYADEALWIAGIDPATRAISRHRAATLLDALREALAAGIANGGTTLRDYRNAEGAAGANQHHLRCYGRAGEPCDRCGSLLRRKIVDGRGTTWCPCCQTR